MYNYYSTDLLHTCQRAPGYLYKLKQTNQRSKPHSHKPRQLASHLSPHPSSHHRPNTKALLPEPSLLTGAIMPVQLSLCSRGITSDGYHFYYTRIPRGGDHLYHIADGRLKPAGGTDIPKKPRRLFPFPSTLASSLEWVNNQPVSNCPMSPLLRMSSTSLSCV